MERVRNIANVINIQNLSEENRMVSRLQERNQEGSFRDQAKKTEINDRVEISKRYKSAGETYEDLKLYKPALNAYQISYSLNPSAESINKIDELTAKIASQKNL